MEEGKWVTLKGGRKVFIKNGQSLTDAINEYDNKLTKKINTTEKRYTKLKHYNDEDKELWNAAQADKLNNKNITLDNMYDISERRAAKRYARTSKMVANAENKIKSLKKEQESFRNATIEAQDQVIEYDKKHFIKKSFNKTSDEKKSFIKSTPNQKALEKGKHPYVLELANFINEKNDDLSDEEFSALYSALQVLRKRNK